MTALISASQELTQQEFRHINERFDTVQIHLENRQELIDTEFSEMHADFQRLKAQVDTLQTTFTRWGAFATILAVLAGPVIYEIVTHLNFG